MATNEFREYENGIADVLASIVGECAVVERNVYLPSNSGGKPRQIDVLVRGTVFGLSDTRLVVDGKHRKKSVDKPAVEAFIGLVEDVGADMGLLVSAAGVSDSAVNRARSVRGTRIKALSVAELAKWQPRGTVTQVVEIPTSELERATRALREAGLRVRLTGQSTEQHSIQVFRHYGEANPSAETQRAHHHQTHTVLTGLGVPYRSVSGGFTVSGGTPAHRWIPVRAAGNPYVLKVLAAAEAELEGELLRLTQIFGVPRALLTADRPQGWPATSAFLF